MRQVKADRYRYRTGTGTRRLGTLYVCVLYERIEKLRIVSASHRTECQASRQPLTPNEGKNINRSCEYETNSKRQTACLAGTDIRYPDIHIDQ